MKRIAVILLFLMSSSMLFSQELVPQGVALTDTPPELQQIGQYLLDTLAVELDLLIFQEAEGSHKQITITQESSGLLSLSLHDQVSPIDRVVHEYPESPGELLSLADSLVVQWADFLAMVPAQETQVFYQEDQQLLDLQEELDYQYRSLDKRNEIRLGVGGSLTAFNMSGGGISAEYSFFPLQLHYSRYKPGATQGVGLMLSYSQGDHHITGSSTDTGVEGFQDLSISAGWAGRLVEDRFSAYYSSTLGASFLRFQESGNSTHLLWEVQAGLCYDVRANYMVGTGLGFHLAFPVGLGQNSQLYFDRALYSLVGGLVLGYRL